MTAPTEGAETAAAPTAGPGRDNQGGYRTAADAGTASAQSSGPVPDADVDPDTDDDGPDVQTLQTEVAKWKALARKHETRAERESKTLQQRVEDMERQIAERDTAQAETNARVALAQVHVRLAENGVKAVDVAGILELIDPTSLLSDGQPNEKAIAKLAGSLAKTHGRVAPDPDQGRQGGKPVANMNDFVRRAAGVGN